MGFKLIQSALTTSTDALYIFVTDTVDDLPNLPNIEQAGTETNTRWFARAGSCARVIGAGRWYILAPSNEWKPLFYMSTEVEDAVEHNVETMREIMRTTEGYKDDAASSKTAAAESEQNASNSESAAAESEKKAKASETAAKNSENAAKESEVLSGKNQIAAADAADKAEASEDAAAASAATASRNAETSGSKASESASHAAAALESQKKAEASKKAAETAREAAETAQADAAASSATAEEKALAASQSAIQASKAASKTDWVNYGYLDGGEAGEVSQYKMSGGAPGTTPTVIIDGGGPDD